MYIIDKCVDKSRLPDGKKVIDRCKRLPLASSGECISVKQYTSMYYMGLILMLLKWSWWQPKVGILDPLVLPSKGHLV